MRGVGRPKGSRWSGQPGRGRGNGPLTSQNCSAIFVATDEVTVRWTWDPNKATANRVKHGLSFETAILVFDDPLHASKPDPHPDGDRWQTIGLVGPILLLVVHTLPEAN